jgi:glucan phosphoethanolaminetransferase (alkaline phosphatase superfamily)
LLEKHNKDQTMKNNIKENGIAIGLSIFIAGFLIWLVGSSSLSGLMRIVAILLLAVAAIAFIVKTRNKIVDRRAGEPEEDEFSRLAKVYAGNRAFHASMGLWLLIFIFNSYFNKHETMLGIGVLGSAAIYGYFLWHYRTSGIFDEESN